ncbi:HoxN/HupN/NixA family nickel/cobalt transporter [Roseibium alexandrii]|uniref:ABC-type uncharacterized transport system, permease component n=1 Tax=Roseibium alexandrii (strain DSM 17067 / NCIMB 14079 / DFL-11) TaxID=244592 RepID=A0A5E8GTV1_ROSAD|nr:DUF3299 domain-containing protein [Roseibium alexandrii]EEE43206.2 ABC-type uncharacterized transport system, permease component [Roseibium alexandrii DFL-11]
MRLVSAVLATVIAILITPIAPPAAAGQLATWSSLAPTVEPYDDPFAEMPSKQISDLRTVLRADLADAAGNFDTDLAEAAKAARLRLEEAGLDIEHLFTQREIIMQRRENETLGVTTTHLDKTIIMDGYVLPLRAEGGMIVEFLLVPWVGACIHTPPPAPNQIVHVNYPEGFEVTGMFTPVRLEGRLTHRPSEYDLFLVDGTRRIPASYAMEQATIGGTPGEIVASETAAADLSWFAAAQAKITNVFTAAMTNMEQGRSAGTVGLALLIAFAYGALHTLGPGHGKAVVISYFIGAGGSLRRGVAMGVQIAVMHVLSAIVIVFLLDFAVRQATGAAPSDYRMIRMASYALIVAIGAVMLWRSLAAVRVRRTTEMAGDTHHHHHHHDDHAHAGCAACSAAQNTARGGKWIAAAVGIVPCTGALIVMLFGLANDLLIPAIMMVLAISAGMAVTMSAIGVAAIWGRNWAETRVATNPQRRFRFEAGARIAAAACVLLIGATLFAGTAMYDPGERPEQGLQLVQSTVPK